MALTAEKAAEKLAEEHEIEAEVIDPRTLRPLDLDTILASVRKTNRCVIVEEGWPHGGVGANLAALIQEQAFDDLDAPIGRVTGADVPMPYSKPLEQIAFPHEPQIVEAVLATFRDLDNDRLELQVVAPCRCWGDAAVFALHARATRLRESVIARLVLIAGARLGRRRDLNTSSSAAASRTT